MVSAVGIIHTHVSHAFLTSLPSARDLDAQIDQSEFFVHPAPLGTNLYNKDDRAPIVPPARQFDTVAPTGSAGGGPEPSPASFSKSGGGAAAGVSTGQTSQSL